METQSVGVFDLFHGDCLCFLWSRGVGLVEVDRTFDSGSGAESEHIKRPSQLGNIISQVFQFNLK